MHKLINKLKNISILPEQITQVDAKLNILHQLINKLKNKNISILLEQITQVDAKLTLLQGDVNALRADVNALRIDFYQQDQLFRKAYLISRYHNYPSYNKIPPSIAQLNELLSISEQLSCLQKLAPQAFSIWRPLLDVNQEAYKGLPVNSCSVVGHSTAQLFRFFLTPYLKERVLDIGCGPQSIPVYLSDYPVEAIYGVDPLSEPDEHPFHFIKGLAEFLPWADSQFKLVVAATSLDHVLLLDKTFEGVCRVLSKDGIFAVWVGFIAEAKVYDPYSPDIERVDNYHLFHFDRDCFLDAIKHYFVVLEEFAVDSESSFFALRPIKQK